MIVNNSREAVVVEVIGSDAEIGLLQLRLESKKYKMIRAPETLQILLFGSGEPEESAPPSRVSAEQHIRDEIAGMSGSRRRWEPKGGVR